MPFITTTDAADDDALPRKSQVEELIAVASGAAEDAQAAADAAQAAADAAQATADAALPASARAADVNPAGTDIAAALGGKLNTSALDTDATMAANSDAKVPSQKATRAYVASVLAGVAKNKGPLDCSANPNYPVALNGDFYRCSVAGKVGGASGIVVEVADLIMCVADNAGGTQASVGTSWIVGQANISGITAAGLAMMQAADEEGQAGLLDAFLLSLSGGTMFENAVVSLFNGSRWQQSTPDKGITGTAGFSIICSAGYEYKFALGYLFVLSDGSSTVRKVLYAPSAPTTTDDTTLGYTTDTTWEMADGTQYRCTDATATAAVWEVVPAFDPAVPGELGATTPDAVNTTGLNVKDSGGTITASINGSDGTASFGYQGGLTGLHIDQFGNLTTSNNAEATLFNFNAANVVSAYNGAITLGTNTGTEAWINSDGSASFANGGLMLDQWGNITSNSGASVEVGYVTAVTRVEVGFYGSAGTLNVRDSSATTTASIDGSNGTLTLAGALIGGTQALVTSGGAGAVNLTTLTTEVETTGTLDALTLANGTVGQIKVITHTVGAFTSVLTPTTALGFTSITFLASLGQTCTLEYTTAGWVILSVGGLTLPVVA